MVLKDAFRCIFGRSIEKGDMYGYVSFRECNDTIVIVTVYVGEIDEER